MDPLRVLILGVEPDARGVEGELQRDGQSVAALRVDSREPFLEALRSLRWHAVVCHHGAGDCDAATAVETARREAPGTPCLAVADQADEEVLVACARAGAADCVSEQRLDRLRGAVQAAVAGAQAAASPPAAGSPPALDTATLDALPYPAWRAGLDGRCTHFNAAWLQFTGRPLEKELGSGWFDGVHPDDRDRCITAHWRAFARGQPYTAEYRLRHHDGTYRWVIDLGRPLQESGPAGGFLALCVDITERRRAEEAMRESVAALKTLLNATSDAALLLDTEGTVIAANETAGTRLGTSADELVGVSIGDLLPAPVRDVRALQISGVLGSGRPTRFEDEVSGVWYENTVYPMRDPAGQITGVAFFEREITAYKRVEQALRDSERSYRQLFEAAGDASLIVDPDTDAVLEANPRAAELYGIGRDELATLTWAALSATAARSLERQVGPIGDSGLVFDTEHARRDGSRLRLRVGASLVEFAGREAVLCVCRDLEDEAALTAQERRDRRIEALENLAGEVAQCYDQLLEELVTTVRASAGHGEEAAVARRRELEAGLLRGRTLARQLLLFARREPGMPERLAVDDLLAETVEVLRRSGRLTSRVEIAEAVGDLAVTADHEQILQVLIALVSNAQEATPGEGRVVIAAQAREGEVEIFVTDEGPGLPRDMQARLFEPFATTHPDRWGAGLGLAVAHGIVVQHGGTVTAGERPGGGAAVRVTLPRALGERSGVRRWAEMT